MDSIRKSERVQVVVIGGGQAGLSVGYCLRQRGLSFVILEANARVGDSWRKRWDSLRLFTPAKYDGLIGLPFPAPAFSFPTKDEMADYLESYARHFELPVRTGVRVERLVVGEDRIAFDSTRDVGAHALRIGVHLPDLLRDLLRRVREMNRIADALAHFLAAVQTGQPGETG